MTQPQQPSDPTQPGWAEPAGATQPSPAGPYPPSPYPPSPYAYPTEPVTAPAYQYPPAAYGAPPGYGPPVIMNPATNGMAIAALICSVVGLGPLGAILGHVARRQIRQTGEQGDGMALAAIIVGWIYTGIFACACAIPLLGLLGTLGTAGTGN